MYLYFKRFFDVIFSLLLILFLLPIFFIIIFFLILSSEGEVFYKQKRVGYKNNDFYIYKFATMLKDSENLGTKDLTVRNDPRVTWVGKYLRLTKINELPQIINVLIGDMSFIGPRPLLRKGFDRYEKHIKDNIYNVKPGLSGIGSIIFRDEEKIITNSNLSPEKCYEKIILPYKGRLELWYQKNISFYIDFMIMFLTVFIIIFPSSNLHYTIFKNLPRNTN